MKNTFICLFILMVWFAAGKVVAQIEPYLSSPSDTSVWISWRTASADDPGNSEI